MINQQSANRHHVLITLKFLIEESPSIEVPNEQILKDQYNNLPECRYQPDITFANTIIHLLEKTMIACRPCYF